MQPARRTSFFLNPNSSLANSQILTVVDDIIDDEGMVDLYENVAKIERHYNTQLTQEEAVADAVASQATPPQAILPLPNFDVQYNSRNCKTQLNDARIQDEHRLTKEQITTLLDSSVQVPTENLNLNKHYHYISTNFINSKYTNTEYNSMFALIRIKMNMEYKNHNTNNGLNINKTRIKLNPDGSNGIEIPYDNQNADEVDDDEEERSVFNMPSEFIDIGISHFSDYNYNHMMTHLDHLYDSFSNIRYNEDEQDFIIGYSLNYIIYDIFQILWLQTAMPWSDKKFDKRIERICALTMYSYIHNVFLQELNRIYDNNIPPNVNITEENFDTIIDSIKGLNKWLKFRYIISILQNLNKIDYNRNRDEYMEIITTVIKKFFKNPEIILNKQLFLKLNENNFIHILECTLEFEDIGEFMKTVLHYIYNKFILDTSTPEEIYNINYNMSVRSNFLITRGLEQYLGKRINNGNITYVFPQDNQEIHVFNDIKNYLNKYLQIIYKWYLFFNNFIFNNLTIDNKRLVATILCKKIGVINNVQHGGNVKNLNFARSNVLGSGLGRTKKTSKNRIAVSNVLGSVLGNNVLGNNVGGRTQTKSNIRIAVSNVRGRTKNSTHNNKTKTKNNKTQNTSFALSIHDIHDKNNLAGDEKFKEFVIPTEIINQSFKNIKEKMNSEIFWNIEFNDFELFQPPITESYRKHNFGIYHNDVFF